MAHAKQRPSLTGLLLAAAVGLMQGGPSAGDVVQRTPRRFGGRFGPYRPHQGTRERCRRVGGAMWDRYRAADRARRGLPVEG